MAIYHFHVTQVSRGKGQSAIAAAAYRAGERLQDHIMENLQIIQQKVEWFTQRL